jgi:hypothetical protein
MSLMMPVSGRRLAPAMPRAPSVRIIVPAVISSSMTALTAMSVSPQIVSTAIASMSGLERARARRAARMLASTSLLILWKRPDSYRSVVCTLTTRRPWSDSLAAP